MKTYKYLLGIIVLIVLASVVSCGTGGGSTANSSNGTSFKSILLYYNGPPQPNTAKQPTIAAFENWCNESCVATTQFPLLDPITNNTVGAAYVWEKDYIFSPDHLTVCVGEFIEYKLQQGTIYTRGNPGATCGAFMDPALVKPIYNPLAIVLSLGGSGIIVGGTLLYQNMQGTYDLNLWLEALNSTVIYYDYLFINLMLE